MLRPQVCLFLVALIFLGVSVGFIGALVRLTEREAEWKSLSAREATEFASPTDQLLARTTAQRDRLRVQLTRCQERFDRIAAGESLDRDAAARRSRDIQDALIER